MNPEGTQVIVGSMNMGYISDTARNRTHNLFRPIAGADTTIATVTDSYSIKSIMVQLFVNCSSVFNTLLSEGKKDQVNK